MSQKFGYLVLRSDSAAFSLVVCICLLASALCANDGVNSASPKAGANTSDDKANGPQAPGAATADEVSKQSKDKVVEAKDPGAATADEVSKQSKDKVVEAKDPGDAPAASNDSSKNAKNENGAAKTTGDNFKEANVVGAGGEDGGSENAAEIDDENDGINSDDDIEMKDDDMVLETSDKGRNSSVVKPPSNRDGQLAGKVDVTGEDLDDDDSPDNNGEQDTGSDSTKKSSGPVASQSDETESSSHFMGYFIASAVVCVALYLMYHNRHKVLAYILEGRRSSTGRRRVVTTGTAEYRQLSHAEEGGVSEIGIPKSEQPKGYVY